MELRDLISQSEEAVRDLEGALNPMRKKYSSMNPEDQEQFRQKEKLVSLIKDQFDSARSSANNEEYVPRKKPDPNTGLTVQKSGNFNRCLELMGNRWDPQEMTGEEAKALERFKQKDEQIDDMLVLVIQDIDLLKQKADNIDGAIERNRKNLKKVSKHADKTSAKVVTMNKKMKDVINKYAQPSKMCLYVVLALLVVGLIMMIYQQMK